jgi:hypothetical protein
LGVSAIFGFRELVCLIAVGLQFILSLTKGHPLFFAFTGFQKELKQWLYPSRKNTGFAPGMRRI